MTTSGAGTAPGASRAWPLLLAALVGAAIGAAGALALDPRAARVGQAAPADECGQAADRLAEVDMLLLDAAAPTLTTWEAGRLLSAASGTLSALEARLHRHGACRAPEIAALRGRIAGARGAARGTALVPVMEALDAYHGVAAGIAAHQALADLAAARVALARAQGEAGDADTDGELRRLQRRLEDAYGAWSREQQRRYDLWALERARGLDVWARANLSDIPLRGAGRPEVEQRMVEALGPVDVRLLGPAVQAVHGELFQRLWQELGQDGRIRVVADLVAAPKRQPGEM